MSKKLVVVDYYGVLHELPGDIHGPILTPTYIDIKYIDRLLRGRKAVYEVDPIRPSKRIQLTRTNLHRINFPRVFNMPKKKMEVKEEIKTVDSAPEEKPDVVEMAPFNEGIAIEQIVLPEETEVAFDALDIEIINTDTMETEIPSTSIELTESSESVAYTHKRNKRHSHGDFKR